MLSNLTGDKWLMAFPTYGAELRLSLQNIDSTRKEIVGRYARE